MTAARDRSDDPEAGSVSVLLIGFVVVAVVTATGVLDLARLLEARARAAAAADAAALAAAARVVEDEDADPAAVSNEAERIAEDNGARLVRDVDIDTDGTVTVAVRVAVPLQLADDTSVTASASATAAVIPLDPAPDQPDG